MDRERLCQLATAFYQEMRTSHDLQAHRADHQRRSQRAQALLTSEHIPILSGDELKELFFDTDAFSFWSNKEWEFNNRLQSVGLEGLRNALLELITRAERGLTPDDLKHVWDMRGLGTLLSTELLAYRFPPRYWTYSSNVTLPALQRLGDDVKASMPRGQKSDPHIYLALETRMAEVCQALRDTGLADVDNLLADIFLWWIKQTTPAGIPDMDAATIEQALRDSDAHKPAQAEWADWDSERYWKISPGERAWAWEEFRQRNVIAVGWKGSWDLRVIAPSSREQLQDSLGRLGIWSGNTLVHVAQQLWTFYHEMQPGDLVCAYGQKQVLGWGKIVGAYTFQEEDDGLRYQHRRAVHWISTEPFSVDRLSTELQKKLQRRWTIFSLTQDEFAGVRQLASSGAPRVWLFQANPLRYDLERGLRKERLNDWQASRYRSEIHSGDQVVFWKAGENRGIYGLGTVVSEIYQRPDRDLVVDVRYEGRLRQPILYEALRDHPVLSQMLIMRQHQGTNFRVTPEEWAALQPLVGEVIPPDPDAIDARQVAQVKLRLLPVLCRWLTKRGLHFTDWQIATFYTALQTKGFVILSGISGTGKTKLAQHFAALLPQPAGEPILSEEQILVTVQPYMLKYARLIIPKRATRLFDPPPPGQAAEIRLAFDRQNETCRLVHAAYGTSDYLSLLLRGRARRWFSQTFAEGDTLILEPELDREDSLTGFRMIAGSNQQKELSAGRVTSGRNWLFIPVRPDWRDSKSLLGYYNPLIGAYEWTPFLRFLLRAVQSYRAGDGLAWFVILDEMNLAHVEYYFADLLSVLESGRDEEDWTREPLRLGYPDEAEGNLPPRELRLPPNLYVMGTVNVDETTHAFSPKVLDRAFTLELTEADFSGYPPELSDEQAGLVESERQSILEDFTFDGAFARIDKQAITDYVKDRPDVRIRLQTLNNLLRPYELHFGYRVFDEIVSFLIAAQRNGMYDGLGGEEAAFDAAILMKVLPKFHGSRSKLEAPLQAVLAWCVDADAPTEELITDALKEAEAGRDVVEVLAQITYCYPRTAERARRMLWALYTTGFAAFG